MSSSLCLVQQKTMQKIAVSGSISNQGPYQDFGRMIFNTNILLASILHDTIALCVVKIQAVQVGVCFPYRAPNQYTVPWGKG